MVPLKTPRKEPTLSAIGTSRRETAFYKETSTTYKTVVGANGFEPLTYAL